MLKCPHCNGTGAQGTVPHHDRPSSLRDFFVAFGILVPASVTLGVWLVLNFG